MAIISNGDELATLAEQIVEEHRGVQDSVKAALRHAIAAGELLLRAKALVAHGGWLPWLREHCDVSERTAQAYMLCARRRLELEANPQRVADLSFRDGLRMLTEKDTTERASDYVHRSWFDCETTFVDRSACQNWPDLMHTFATVADARGWSAEEIAEHLPADLEEVKTFLCPRVPIRSPMNFSVCGVQFGVADEVATAYADTVAWNVSRLMWVSYYHGAWLAEVEGWHDTAAHLTALRQQEERKRDRLEDRTIYSLCVWQEDDLPHALSICALSDARAALGIEPVCEFDELWERSNDCLTDQNYRHCWR